MVSRQCRRLGWYLSWRCTGFSRCGWRIWGKSDRCQVRGLHSPVVPALTSQLTCGEVKCTDNLLPTCCVCHGTHTGITRRRPQYRAILPRPGATSGCHISLLICPSGRWLAGNKQGLAACAGPRPWSPISQSRLRAWERRYSQGREAGEAGSRGQGLQTPASHPGQRHSFAVAVPVGR